MTEETGNTTSAGPDDFPGSDEGSHYMSQSRIVSGGGAFKPYPVDRKIETSEGPLIIRECSEHHVQVRTEDGGCLAQWWPRRGKTQIGQDRGPRCEVLDDLIDVLVARARGGTMAIAPSSSPARHPSRFIAAERGTELARALVGMFGIEDTGDLENAVHRVLKMRAEEKAANDEIEGALRKRGWWRGSVLLSARFVAEASQSKIIDSLTAQLDELRAAVADVIPGGDAADEHEELVKGLRIIEPKIAELDKIEFGDPSLRDAIDAGVFADKVAELLGIPGGDASMEDAIAAITALRGWRNVIGPRLKSDAALGESLRQVLNNVHGEPLAKLAPDLASMFSIESHDSGFSVTIAHGEGSWTACAPTVDEALAAAQILGGVDYIEVRDGLLVDAEGGPAFHGAESVTLADVIRRAHEHAAAIRDNAEIMALYDDSGHALRCAVAGRNPATATVWIPRSGLESALGWGSSRTAPAGLLGMVRALADATPRIGSVAIYAGPGLDGGAEVLEPLAAVSILSTATVVGDRACVQVEKIGHVGTSWTVPVSDLADLSQEASSDLHERTTEAAEAKTLREFMVKAAKSAGVDGIDNDNPNAIIAAINRLDREASDSRREIDKAKAILRQHAAVRPYLDDHVNDAIAALIERVKSERSGRNEVAAKLAEICSPHRPSPDGLMKAADRFIERARALAGVDDGAATMVLAHAESLARWGGGAETLGDQIIGITNQLASLKAISDERSTYLGRLLAKPS